MNFVCLENFKLKDVGQFVYCYHVKLCTISTRIISVHHFSVTHTCCSLRPRPPNYDGNDCFVYELPDGKSIPAAIHTGGGNPEYTVLSHATTEPEDFGDYSGYRLRLFLLKNKSPPTLIVKGIERKRYICYNKKTL